MNENLLVYQAKSFYNKFIAYDASLVPCDETETEDEIERKFENNPKEKE